MKKRIIDAARGLATAAGLFIASNSAAVEAAPRKDVSAEHAAKPNKRKPQKETLQEMQNGFDVERAYRDETESGTWIVEMQKRAAVIEMTKDAEAKDRMKAEMDSDIIKRIAALLSSDNFKAAGEQLARLAKAGVITSEQISDYATAAGAATPKNPDELKNNVKPTVLGYARAWSEHDKLPENASATTR